MAVLASAEPLQLYTFASRASGFGHELLSEASRLSSALSRFEAVCREYPVHVGYLPGAISSHARASIALADWVRDVGTDFLRADADRFWAWAAQRDLYQKVLNTRPWFERLMRLLTGLQAAGMVPLLIAVRAGRSYPHQMIVNYPQWLLRVAAARRLNWAAGLKGGFRHGSWARVLKGSLRGTVVTTFVVLTITWGYDAWQYQGTQLASALTIDTGLVLLTLGAAALITVAIVAVFGAPLLAAGLIGGAIAGLAIEFTLGGERRDKAIAWTDDHVFKPLSDKISQGTDAISAAVDGAARRFKQGWQQMVDVLTPAAPSLAPGYPFPGPAPVPTPTPSPAVTPAPPSVEPVPIVGEFKLTRLPVDVVDNTWTQDFGWTRFAKDNPEIYNDTGGIGHNGLDLVCPVGTDVRSPASVSGTVISRNNDPYPYAAGPNNVVIDYGDYVMVFGHTGSTDHLKVGQKIEPGEVFVKSGTDGVTPHLHFEVRLKDPEAKPGERPGGANYQDPWEFLDSEARKIYDGLPGYKKLEQQV